jgi:hypothetical protein
MKRQARPFVVETKRSRKAPTNLWASTPLLQQELAAASAPEPRAEAIFADRSKDQATEPARRILQSLIVEAPAAEAEADEPEEPAAPRRRTRRDGDGDGEGEMRSEPARRGRPRRIAVAAEGNDTVAEAVAAPAHAVKAPSEAAPRTRKPAAPKAAKSKSAVAAGVVETPAAGAREEPVSASQRHLAEADGGAGARGSRIRAARNPAAAALLPGERWKRRLPQRLW